MPSTPLYLFPYPAGTDPADGPTGFSNLANRMELVLHDQIYTPLAARLTTVETTLVGVSNDGTGNLTLTKGLTVNTTLHVKGASTLDDDLTCKQDLYVYGGNPTTQMLHITSNEFGTFGKSSGQYGSGALTSFINLVSDTNAKGALNEIKNALRGYGFLS